MITDRNKPKWAHYQTNNKSALDNYKEQKEEILQTLLNDSNIKEQLNIEIKRALEDVLEDF